MNYSYYFTHYFTVVYYHTIIAPPPHVPCRCHNLVYLSVCFCEHISEAGIELLGQTHSLTSIDISGCNCGDQGLSALGRLRSAVWSHIVVWLACGICYVIQNVIQKYALSF